MSLLSISHVQLWFRLGVNPCAKDALKQDSSWDHATRPFKCNIPESHCSWDLVVAQISLLFKARYSFRSPKCADQLGKFRESRQKAGKWKQQLLLETGTAMSHITATILLTLLHLYSVFNAFFILMNIFWRLRISMDTREGKPTAETAVMGDAALRKGKDWWMYRGFALTTVCRGVAWQAASHPGTGEPARGVEWWPGSSPRFHGSSVWVTRPNGNFSSDCRLPSTTLVPILAFGFFISESCT